MAIGIGIGIPFRGGRGGGAAWADVTAPVGWDWVLPFAIQKKGDEFQVDPAFDLQAYANITVTKTYYVDGALGNDGATGADWAHALKTLKVAQEKADVDRIYCRDLYTYNSTRVASPARSMEIIGVGDNVKLTADIANLMSAWTAVDNHYTCTVTAYSYAGQAFDLSNIDADGYPTRANTGLDVTSDQAGT